MQDKTERMERKKRRGAKIIVSRGYNNVYIPKEMAHTRNGRRGIYEKCMKLQD